jgi:multiple sugar transport system substrate-binding protein
MIPRAIQSLWLMGSMVLLTSCSGGHNKSPPQAQIIKLWVGPNEAEESFWKVAVAQWNASGQGLQVSFTTIPTSGNSEETVLSALVAQTEPDVSTNIFSGFVMQLADLKQLEPLSSMPGYAGLIERRHMTKLIGSWQMDGKVYAIPFYSNPALIWWRADILAKYANHKIPRTYEDVYQLSQRYAVAEHRYGFQVFAGRGWEDRWFDFIAFYYAASNGRAYIENGKATYNNADGLKVAAFIDRMYEQGWTAADFDAGDPLVSGMAAGAVHGPWDLGTFQRMYPETMKNIVIGPIISDAEPEAHTATFADSKGIVLFRRSKVKKEAFAFISWALGDEHLNLLWLQKTGMMPARDDLLHNPVFADFFNTHPAARVYASYVDVAMPPALNENTIDIQKVMTQELVGPLVFRTKAPRAALDDAASQTDKLLRVLQ